MSGLGQLLLGAKLDGGTSDPKSEDPKRKNSNNNENDGSARRIKREETDMSPRDSRDDGSHSSSKHRRTFPNRVEKGSERDAETHSNASSTDDYVRELLDPNDRPRNVWHVVEGPKRSSDEDTSEHRVQTGQQINENSSKSVNIKPEANMNISPESRDHSNLNKVKSEPDDTGETNCTHPYEKEENDGRIDRDKIREDRSTSRHRSPRTHDDWHRDDRRHKDSSRERHGSSSSRHRSHKNRRDHSDDEDMDRDRRHRDRSVRHGGRTKSRSRSRSPARSSSRRRDRSGSNSPQRNPRTVIVMQLSQRVVTRDLEDYFGDHVGNVREVRLIMDSRTRRHKGVAYIEFNDSRSASKALSLSGRKIHGAPITIQPVNSRSSDYPSSTSHNYPSSSSRSNHHHSSSTHPSSRSLPPNAYRVYIGALHTAITDEMLRTIVEPFGPVLRVEVIKDRATGLSRGYAFVTYASIEDGQEAVRCLDGFELAAREAHKIIASILKGLS